MKRLFDGIRTERELTARYLLELSAIGDRGAGAKGQIRHDELHAQVTKQYDQAKRRLVAGGA